MKTEEHFKEQAEFSADDKVIIALVLGQIAKPIDFTFKLRDGAEGK